MMCRASSYVPASTCRAPRWRDTHIRHGRHIWVGPYVCHPYYACPPSPYTRSVNKRAIYVSVCALPSHHMATCKSMCATLIHICEHALTVYQYMSIRNQCTVYNNARAHTMKHDARNARHFASVSAPLLTCPTKYTQCNTSKT